MKMELYFFVLFFGVCVCVCLCLCVSLMRVSAASKDKIIFLKLLKGQVICFG